jgi:hypothetical protein
LPIEGKYSRLEYSGAKLSINKYQSNNDSSFSSLFLPFEVCMGNDGKCIGNHNSFEHFNHARFSMKNIYLLIFSNILWIICMFVFVIWTNIQEECPPDGFELQH